jgi:hypothetical protein
MNLRNVLDVAHERSRFQDRCHHRLREIAERKLFEVTLHDPEWPAIATERRKFERLSAHYLEKTIAALEYQ